MYKKLFFLLMILGITIVQAQEKNITGIVYETFGPLPGVNVLVKGIQPQFSINLKKILILASPSLT